MMDDRQQLYELAGMTALDGGLDRVFPIDEWWVPGSMSLQARGETFSLIADASEGHMVSADAKLLTRFLRLKDSPTEILSFASEWGLLGSLDYALRYRGDTLEEPVERWYAYRRKLNAILDVTAMVSGRGPVSNYDDLDYWSEQVVEDEETGEVLYAPPPPIDRRSKAEKRRDELLGVAFEDLDGSAPRWIPRQVFGTVQADIAAHINTLLRRMMVIPGVSWHGDHPVLRVSSPSNSLLVALVYRTSLAMCRVDDLPICDGCGSVYEISRKPKSNQRQFCPDCRASGVPQRRAAQAYRDREREKKNGEAR